MAALTPVQTVNVEKDDGGGRGGDDSEHTDRTVTAETVFTTLSVESMIYSLHVVRT